MWMVGRESGGWAWQWDGNTVSVVRERNATQHHLKGSTLSKLSARRCNPLPVTVSECVRARYLDHSNSS